MELTKLVIDPTKWARPGSGCGLSQMLNRQGCMCCLGFLGSACGYIDEQLAFQVSPGDVAYQSLQNRFPSGVVVNEHLKTTGKDSNSEWTLKAMKINDNPSIDDVVRRALLIKHFKLIGIELSFLESDT